MPERITRLDLHIRYRGDSLDLRLTRGSSVLDQTTTKRPLGSVVDMRFEQHLLPIYTLLRAEAKSEISIEVLAQQDWRAAVQR